MKKPEAEQLVINTFTQKFSEEQFTNFIRNLLPGLEPPSTRTVPNAQLPQGFREHVYNYTRVGTYHDPKGDVLDVVIVKLKNQGSLERARTRQRNLMSHYLTQRTKDAVLVAYITDDPSDWRFSFVKLAFQTEITDQGKVKANRKYTPARRYSFLVGQHEPNHTAQKQLGNLLMREGKPTLEQIEEAFNIESVTKEFFEKYKNLFLMIKENLDRIVETKPKVQVEFTRCEIDTANFAKKLLGQIVFLYFLQKKGWLGVATDQAWGTGDKKFLSNLFEKNKDMNFFDEILEPFFYEALAMERKGDFYPTLQCKVPFLNGGLFEPLNGYDWKHTSIGLNNKDFEEIFQEFNLYNFTVREDEPLEKEVAVDPEMLGKVFENLLEVKDRKGKGAFYTPREIVHYMCQESLINYLNTALNQKEINLTKEDGIQADLFGKKPEHQMVMKEKIYQEVIPLTDIEAFIREGELSIERDEAREEGKLGNDGYGLPESIRNHAKVIDFALADVKICDPAIGSGAFPVGMMTEIVRARRVISPYLPNQHNRDTYKLKWHCIENSLYGVDIDASAVEIAKLRLWLSLVVDEESYDKIRPLPNLDYRIVKGNSLLGYPYQRGGLGRLEKLKEAYFLEAKSREKSLLKVEIEKELVNIFSQTKKSLGYQVTMDFRINFSEVFRKKDGFDIVIGNPPYISAVHHSKSDKENRKTYRVIYPLLNGSYDLYTVFLLLGVKIANSLGHYCWIIPNKFLVSDYSKDVLKHLQYNGLYSSIDVSTFDVFDGTGVYPIIIFGSKHLDVSLSKYELSHIDDLKENNLKIQKKGFLDNVPTIKDYGLKISSGTTGYQAKSIIPLLSENQKQGSIPFIVSGCVDRYTIDFTNVRYMKNTYKQAFIKKGPQIADSKWKFWKNRKIIIAGMTKQIESVYSEDGIALGVGIYAIHSFSQFSPYYILGVLNSKLLSYYFMNKFRDKHLAGGYLGINKSTIEKLPLIKAKEEDELSIANLAKEVSIHGINSETEKLIDQIDKIVYSIFRLTEEEIMMVEESVRR